MSRKQKDVIENSLDEEEDEAESYSDEEEEEEIPKKTKANSKKRAKSGVKKSITAYSYYMKDRGAKIKAENPSLSFGEISKKLSSEWKELSDEEKKPYQDKASEDKKRYEKEKKEYMESNKDGPSKKKKVKDPNAPKKNKNAYMFYTQMMRPKIIEELGPSESKKTTQVTKLIGTRWNQLSNEEKKPYEDMAKKDKERYEKEFAVYKKQLGEVK